MDDLVRNTLVDHLRDGVYAADLFTVDFQRLASCFGSNDAVLEAAVLAELCNDVEAQSDDEAERAIEELSPGIAQVIAGARALDAPGRWGFYYLARHIAQETGTAGLPFVDPGLEGSGSYLVGYDDDARDAGISLPVAFVDVAVRGVPQVGKLEGCACYPAGGQLEDFLPTLGFLTPQECKASLEVLTALERIPEGLRDLLPLFAGSAHHGHGILVCVSDWFPHASW